MGANKPRLVVAIAVKEEAFTWQPAGIDIVTVYTGIGKAAAATALTEAILRYRPTAVINVGTAGTLHHHIGDIIVARHFVDRDLQPLAIAGITSSLNANNSDAMPFAFASHCADGSTTTANMTLSTGDSFVTDTAHAVGDVVDMEGFAEAFVCQRFGLPFLAIKYVTDIIGQNSVAHWEEKLQQAREGLTAYFENYR